VKPACMTPEEFDAWEEANRSVRGMGKAESPCRDCTPLFHADMVDGGMCDGTPGSSGQPTPKHEEHPRYSVVSSQPNTEGAAMTVSARRASIVDIDPDLGPVRFCARCGEWWPQDAEFWIIQVRPAGIRNTSRGRSYVLLHDVTGYTCRACRREQQTAYARRRRAVA
jgi:hypothetical protein